MPPASRTHLVLIPSYNPGAKAVETVSGARRHWSPVWVVIDGSTDGSAEALVTLAAHDAGLRVIVLPDNRGKGAAVLTGLRAALAAGFTHVLTLDADGQHPAERIPEFMAASLAAPERMVLGEPVFDAAAPLLRVRGRRISNWFANLETLWAGVHDSLFGFRVYPAATLERIMRYQPWMRRFDFDVEAAVRLCWRGVAPLNLRAPVRYFTRAQGGVSHFRYGRDNALLAWMHARLLLGFLLRVPSLAWRRLAGRPPFATAPPSAP
jgi:glycosyltransferase involved in cell wall biosynthesis